MTRNRNRLAGAAIVLATLLGPATALHAQETKQAEGYAEPEQLIGPLPFVGVHGLAITDDGRLLAGSVVGQTLSQVDPQTGEVTVLIGPPKGMADDIAIGPKGTLAWTSFLAGTLRIRTPEGEIITVASGLPGINSLDFSEDGRLFATQVFLGDALYEIDPTGQEPPRAIAKDLGGLNGFEVGEDGWIYGPLWFKGEVVRVNPDNGKIEVVADGFKTPAAANFGPDGNLYVIDTTLGRLYRVDTETGEKTTVAQLKPSLDNLAIGGDGTIYVSNMADISIQAVDPETGEVRTLTQSELAAPAGLALVDDTLYVADIFAFRSMNTKTGEVTDIKRMFASDIHYPGTASANDEHVILASGSTGTVQILDRKTAETLKMLHGFKAPYDAVELPDGSLLVAELGSGSLLKVSGEKGEQREAVVSGLKGPVGLALAQNDDRTDDDNGSTAYLSTVAGNIWAIDTSDWSKTKVAGGLKQPEGIALTPDGHLVVMEVGAERIVRIDPETGDVTVIASGIPMSLPTSPKAPTGVLNDVAVSADGDLYFSTMRNAGLYRIQRK